jgi:hypothetical protein
MRKFVKPADRGASIPSPAHGRDLPQDGLEVEWSAYWARLEMRGDIVVSEIRSVSNEADTLAPPSEDDSKSPPKGK